jgi:hemerythrin-like domain-containing protein
MTAEIVTSGAEDRRSLLRMAISAAGIALVGCVGSKAPPEHAKSSGAHAEKEAEVAPGEDLMQEHGVLERILLIYDEAAGRIERSERVDLQVVTSAAHIVRRFVEDYHERNEEQFVFPRLEKARQELGLVAVLRRQHQRGREVTDELVRFASAGTQPGELAKLIRAFERMYRPHAAREDTVLFPAFRKLMGNEAYRELGEQFEDEEHKRFGAHGFENTVAEVARLEQALGIGDLAAFTP